MRGIRAFCHSCQEECGALVGIHSNPRWRQFFPKRSPGKLNSKMAVIVPTRILGTFLYMRSHKMADTNEIRYLWNLFYSYSNQYIVEKSPIAFVAEVNMADDML